VRNSANIIALKRVHVSHTVYVWVRARFLLVILSYWLITEIKHITLVGEKVFTRSGSTACKPKIFVINPKDHSNQC
jgi:hypothetical protein